MKTDSHSMKYVSNEGTEILLTVPWGRGTGMIPPPIIEFHSSEGIIKFTYQGTK